MKISSTEEIIEEVEFLKQEMKCHDFQMGIGGNYEKGFFNRINKILRMLKQPVRKVSFVTKDENGKKKLITFKARR